MSDPALASSNPAPPPPAPTAPIVAAVLLTATRLLLAPTATAAATPLFSAEQVVTTQASGAKSVVAADLDGDGDTDLASVSATDDTVAWYRNDEGVFVERVVTTTADAANDVAVGDLDGDGDPDLVVTRDATEVPLLWFENRIEAPDPAPEFVGHDLSSTTSDNWRGVALADHNRDGALDVAAVTAADDGTLLLFTAVPGSGPPSFPDDDSIDNDIPGLVDVAWGDVDSDGDLDLVVGAETATDIRWFENQGPFFNDLNASTALDGTSCVIVTDLDRDGSSDFVSTAGTANELDWHRNEGDQFFTEQLVGGQALDPKRVVAADLDGDGDLDLAAASAADNTIAWHENDGAQGFTERIVGTSALAANDVLVADLDEDGDLDLAAASTADHTIAWYENLLPRRSALLPAAIELDGTLGGFAGVAAGDINGDGFVDLVFAAAADTASGNLVRYYTFGNVRNDNLAVGAAQFVRGVNSVELHDLDGDGDLDVLTAAPLGGGADPFEGDVAWHENLGGLDFEPTFAHHLLHGQARLTRHATAGDVDGDGDLDVVAAVGGESSIFWYENLGVGTFAGPQPMAPAGTVANVRSVAIADLDQDGDLDVAFAATGEGEVGWLLNDGDRLDPTFTRPERPVVPAFAAPFWVEVGDLDGDGHPDLVATSVTNGRVAWFHNDGGSSPTFSLGADQTGGLVGAAGAELADVDADGDLDVLVATRNLDRVQWMENPGLEGPGDLLRRPLPPVLDGALALATADLDRNGTLDVAVASEGAGGVTWIPAQRAVFWDDFERGDLNAWSDHQP